MSGIASNAIGYAVIALGEASRLAVRGVLVNGVTPFSIFPHLWRCIATCRASLHGKRGADKGRQVAWMLWEAGTGPVAGRAIGVRQDRIRKPDQAMAPDATGNAVRQDVARL